MLEVDSIAETLQLNRFSLVIFDRNLVVKMLSPYIILHYHTDFY